MLSQMSRLNLRPRQPVDSNQNVGLANSKLNARYSKKDKPSNQPVRATRPHSAIMNGGIGLSKSQLNSRYSSHRDLSGSKLNQQYQNGPFTYSKTEWNTERHNSGLCNKPTDNTAKDKILCKLTKDRLRRGSQTCLHVRIGHTMYGFWTH